MMKSIHILLIEDNEGDILLTAEELGDDKILNTISIARDGWEAIQYLEKEGEYTAAKDADIILLDINLPKLNGYEVLKKIKSNNDLKHIPVIIITSSSSENDILHSYQNFAAGFITKPFKTIDFIKVIASLGVFGINIVQLPTNNII